MMEKSPREVALVSRNAVQLLTLLLLVPAVLLGGSYLPTTDEDLVARADVIGTFTVVASNSYYGADGLIYTTHRLDPEESIKCGRGSFPLPSSSSASGRGSFPLPSSSNTCTNPLYITELGGIVGDRLFSVSTTPSYTPGERVLAFLSARNGKWTTLDGQLGKYTFARDLNGREILVNVATAFSRGLVQAEKTAPNVTPTAPPAESPSVRPAAEMLTRLRTLARGEDLPQPPAPFTPEPPLFVVPNSLFPGNAFLTQFSFSNPGGARWPGMGFAMLHQGSATNADAGAVFDVARATWNDDPRSNINIVNSGMTGTLNYGTSNDINVIHFGVSSTFCYGPSTDRKCPLAGNVIGQAQVWATSQRNTLRGEQFYTAAECDVIVQTGLSGDTLTEVSAHELGHCLGFRHSNQGEPNSTNALMNSTVTGAGPFLRDWDREAANAVYGDGTIGTEPPCVPPSIVTQPQAITIFTGQTATLSVAAGGDGPFAYQWFAGGSPSTGSAVQDANAASFTTPPLNAPQTYSVLVTTSCGSVESTVATVTPVACSTPTITAQPRNRTIYAGQTATLSVIASTVGPVSYQWYQGLSGNTANPIPGATGQVLTTPPLTGLAQYWVRVSNTCDRQMDSATATVSTVPRPAGRLRTVRP